MRTATANFTNLGNITLQIQAAAIYDATVTPNNFQVGASSQYSFAFWISTPIPALGKIQIEFPVSDISVPNSPVASVSVFGGVA